MIRDLRLSVMIQASGDNTSWPWLANPDISITKGVPTPLSAMRFRGESHTTATEPDVLEKPFKAHAADAGHRASSWEIMT